MATRPEGAFDKDGDNDARGSNSPKQEMGKDSRHQSVTGGPVSANSTLPWIIQYLWVPLWGFALWLFRIAWGHHGEIKELKQENKDRAAMDEKILKSLTVHNGNLSSHNEQVLREMSMIRSATETNGKRIARIEGYIMEGQIGGRAGKGENS